MRTQILLLLLRLLLPEVLVLLLPCSSIFFLIETQTLLFFFWVLFLGFVFKPSNYFSFLFFFLAKFTRGGRKSRFGRENGNHDLQERRQTSSKRGDSFLEERGHGLFKTDGKRIEKRIAFSE